MRAVDHYLQAEELIERSAKTEVHFAEANLREAQVHATLALAGATALQSYARVGEDDGELDDWKAAAGGES